MSLDTKQIPLESYGILVQDIPGSESDEIAEQVRRLGYAVFDSGYTVDELSYLSAAFNQTRTEYIQKYGEELLRKANEYNTVRAPLTHGDPIFLHLATNSRLLALLSKLIVGRFILNQQNCVINPPGEKYNQGAWHRDLPYQHYVSNTPLAVNALFCLDDFTLENGSTFVLPGTHLAVSYPSSSYIQRNAVQIEAKAGQYILLDCMLYHSGGFNITKFERRAINHVYTIPYFKQQIKLPQLLRGRNLELNQSRLLGFGYEEPASIDEYISSRIS